MASFVDGLARLSHASHPEREMVRIVGAIPPLIALFKSSEDMRIIGVATACVRQLASHPPHRPPLLAAGAVPLLVQLLVHHAPRNLNLHGIRVGNLGNLGNLAIGRAGTSRSAIAGTSAGAQLPTGEPLATTADASVGGGASSSAHPPTPSLAIDAAAALHDLSHECLEAVDAIRACGGVAALIRLLDPCRDRSTPNEELELRREASAYALRTLANLLAEDGRRGSVGSGKSALTSVEDGAAPEIAGQSAGAVASAICAADGLPPLLAMLGQGETTPPKSLEAVGAEAVSEATKLDGLSARERRKRERAAAADEADEAAKATAAVVSSRGSRPEKVRDWQREMAEQAMGVVRQIVATHVGMAQTHLTIRVGRGALTIICPLVRLMLRTGLTSTAARHACATLRLVLGGEADDSKATVAALEAMLAASKGAGYEGQGWSLAFPELRELLHPVVRRQLQASIDAVLASIERIRDAPPGITVAEGSAETVYAAGVASAPVGAATAKAMQSIDGSPTCSAHDGAPPTAWQTVAESADDPELALVAMASAEAKAPAATSAQDAAPAKPKPAYLSFVERQLAVQAAAKAAASKASAARTSGLKTAASKPEAMVSVTEGREPHERHESSLHRFRGVLALAAAAELPADEVQRAEAAFQEAQARRTRERLVRQQAATAEKPKVRVGAPAMAPTRPAAVAKAAAAAAAAEAAAAEAAAAEKGAVEAAVAEKGAVEAAVAEKAAAEAAAAEKAAAETAAAEKAAAEKAAAEAAATEKALVEAAEKAAESAPVEPLAAEPTAVERGTGKGGGEGFFASLVSLVSHLPFLAPAAAPSNADLSTVAPSISPPRARSLNRSRLINPEWDRRTPPRSKFDGTYLPIGGSSPIFESISRADAPPLLGWAGGSPRARSTGGGARSPGGSPGARSAGGADDHLPLASCHSVLVDLAAGGSPLVAPLSSLFSRGAADAHLGASLSSQRKLNLWRSRWEDKHNGHETAMWEAPVRALTALAPALSAGSVPLVRVGSGAQVSLQTLSTIHGLLDDGRPDAVMRWRNS